MNKFRLPNIKEETTVLKTIRLKYKNLQKIEELSKNYDISINRVINECIEFALDNFSEEEFENLDK